jgi:hypothetical protein
MPPFDKLRRQVRERREPLSALLSCTSCTSFPGAAQRNPESRTMSLVEYPTPWTRIFLVPLRGPATTRRLILSGDVRKHLPAFSSPLRPPSYSVPLLLRERRSRRWSVGRSRRLRRRANVACRPGRFRPRVPLPPLRAVRAGRAHSPEANALGGSQPPQGKEYQGGAERAETEIAGRAAGRSHYLLR